MTRIPTFPSLAQADLRKSLFQTLPGLSVLNHRFYICLIMWKTWGTRRKEWVCPGFALFTCIHEAREVYSRRALRERSRSHGFCHSGSEWHLLQRRNFANSQQHCRNFHNGFPWAKMSLSCSCISSTDRQVWLHAWVFQQGAYDLSVLILL